MHQPIARYATLLGEGQLQGKLFRIDWYPGVVDSDSSLDLVTGEVYQMNKPDKLLPLLDEFELYDSENPDSSEYLRVVRPVKLVSGEYILCQLYLFNAPLENAEQIPSGVF